MIYQWYSITRNPDVHVIHPALIFASHLQVVAALMARKELWFQDRSAGAPAMK